MKRWGLVLAALFILAPMFAQTVTLPEYIAASGKWSLVGDRLFQNDETARLAKVNFRVPQTGPMIYEFNARYEGGGEDGHGGFGIHLFADTVSNRASWGSGNSHLLWLNYDEKPSNPRIPAGLSAQIYRSYNNSGDMRLVESIDLNEYAENVTDEDLEYPVKFVIWVDGDTGEIRVYDPTDETGTSYFYYNIDKKDLPRKGSWVTLRTNGVKLSFSL